MAAWCKITFGDNPLSYAHHLYQDEDTEVTEIVIPDDITSIGDYTFYGCSALTDAPSELPAITLSQDCYASMFSGCTSLKKINFNIINANINMIKNKI